jgi:uncharacterized protein YjcR
MNWEDIRKEWETSKITLKDLAAKHDIKEGTLKSRKSREGWTRDATKKDATQRKKVATKNKDAKKKHPMVGNKNAVGNRGNPSPVKKFTKRNTAAVKHGFFSKYLPQETLDIMEDIQEKSPSDMIWEQIMIQYAAIIRAQKIMFVVDENDMAKEKSQEGWGESGADKYDIQFAWDRHATFMNAQSRAMSELRSLIKHFDEIAHIDDERRLKLQQMNLNIEKTKAEVEKINNPDSDQPIEITIKRKGDAS